jgi:hypothetical protein
VMAHMFIKRSRFVRSRGYAKPVRVGSA